VVDFGISLGAPTAEEMGDRHAYYRDLLVRGGGSFSSAWVSDHLMKDDWPMLEGWTTIAFLAAEFPGYTFGNLVLSQSYRNPALLAKMAATLQYLTDGRLILGIGAGWQADEYLAYDYPYPSAGTRVEQLSEAIDVLRAMWTQSPASYDGQYYHLRNAYCEPRPATPIPIFVGGHRPKFMRVAAAKADIWQWDGPIERFRVPYDLLVAACAELGRDLSSVRLSTSCEAYFPADPADFPEPTRAQITAAQDPSGSYADEIDWVVGPTPEDAIRQLQPLIDLGVTLVTVYVHDRRTLDRFAEEVIPAFGNESGRSASEAGRTATS
jgi:alkanesulfonate monooxygenase SsuD/methylene tetrahydromethanopterin reductase-like flavin-dependent oxidoreductase (luciferase family)